MPLSNISVRTKFDTPTGLHQIKLPAKQCLILIFNVFNNLLKWTKQNYMAVKLMNNVVAMTDEWWLHLTC